MTDYNFSENKKGLFSILIVVLIVFLGCLIVLTGVNIANQVRKGRYIGQEIKTKNNISVSGKGEIYAEPDLALVTFAVKNEAKQVPDAIKKNSEKMNKIISSLKQQGIAEKDLKTTSFYVYPRYEYRKVETGIYPYPPGKRVFVAYEVTQSLQVKIRDLSKIGKIIQEATDNGANQIGNLQFTIDKQDELEVKAREIAIKKAKSKAKQIASQLGVHLVRVTSFSENSSEPHYYYPLMAKAAPMAGKEVTPQIETGENKIESNVIITYEIQ